MIKTNNLTIDTSDTGLVSVAIIHKNNFNFVILEKQIQEALKWGNYYDGLHLQTSNKTMAKTVCISVDFNSPSAGILKKTEIEAKAIAYVIFKHKKA